MFYKCRAWNYSFPPDLIFELQTWLMSYFPPSFCNIFRNAARIDNTGKVVEQRYWSRKKYILKETSCSVFSVHLGSVLLYSSFLTSLVVYLKYSRTIAYCFSQANVAKSSKIQWVPTEVAKFHYLLLSLIVMLDPTFVSSSE